MFPSVTNYIVASTPLSWVLYFFATVFPLLVIAAAIRYLSVRPVLQFGVFAPIERLVERTTEIFRVAVTLIAAWCAAAILKVSIHVPRPFITHTDLTPLFLKSDFSFPSEHAAIFAALAFMLYKLDRRAGYWAGAAALIIGAARVIAGIHTPLDIFGGYLLGMLVAYCGILLVQRKNNAK